MDGCIFIVFQIINFVILQNKENKTSRLPCKDISAWKALNVSTKSERINMN